VTTPQSYGDACRFAHALDLVGRRWALLIVRELMLGPKRFTDLRAGLPHASSNILSERLRELEESGVVRRRKLPPPISARVYELTEWGRELEPVVTQLGAWGARAPVPPTSRTIGTDSIVLALRSLFDPETAGDLEASYELILDGERFRADVSAGELGLRRDGDGEPTVTIEAQPGTLAALLTRRLSIDEALGSGTMRIEGARKAVRRFLSLFPMPEPCSDQASALAESGVEVTR
jgi:DNA-binding HxlR family transcriptional regulator